MVNTVSLLKHFLEVIMKYSFEVVFSVTTKEITEANYEWEPCWVLKFVLVAGKCNKIFLFVSFKWELDSCVFQTWLAAI